MNWEALLNGAVGAGAIGVIYKVLDYYLSRNKSKAETKHLDAQTESEISKAADAIAEGSTAAITNLLRSIEFQKAEIEIIKEARRVRDIETQKERDELKARIQADLIETQRLRNEHATQQKQMLRVEDLAIRAGEYIDKIVNVMKENKMDIPLNGELMDSVSRLKAERASRGKE